MCLKSQVTHVSEIPGFCFDYTARFSQLRTEPSKSDNCSAALGEVSMQWRETHQRVTCAGHGCRRGWPPPLSTHSGWPLHLSLSSISPGR